MKLVYVRYTVVAVIILLVTFAKFFHIHFIDEFDAKNILAGISIGLFIKLIRFQMHMNKSEKMEL